MKKMLSGNWPMFVFVLMFLTLPLSTIPGMFELVFIVLGLFTVAIAALVIYSLVAGRKAAEQE